MSFVLVCTNSVSDECVDEICNTQITSLVNTSPARIQGRLYRQVRPYRTVNTVLLGETFAWHLLRPQMVNFVSCKVCRGLVGYRLEGFFYLFNVAEIWNDLPLYSEGFESDLESTDDDWETDSESGVSGDGERIVAQVHCRRVHGSDYDSPH